MFCRLVRGTEPHGYCRSHNHTATCSAMLQSIMPSARLARYRQRRYAKHCSAVSRGDLARRSKFPYKTSTARCPRGFSHRRTNVLLFLFLCLVRHRIPWVLPLAQSYSYPFRYVTIHNAICSLGKIPPEGGMRNIAPPSPAEILQGGANSCTSPHYVRTIHIKHPIECPFALGIFPSRSAAPYQAGHTPR